MTPTLSFSVPLLPPSVNHYKRAKKGGGWFSGPEAVAFKDAVAILGRGYVVEGWPAPWRLGKGERVYYAAEITLYIRESKFLRVDAENFCKVAVDSLTHAALITDDRYIIDERVRKFPVTNSLDERTHYLVRVV